MEQLQVGIRCFGAAMAVLFLVLIVWERKREHDPSYTEYFLMAGFVAMAALAIIPEISRSLASVFAPITLLPKF